MKDLKEEVGTKACIVGQIVKSRMKWTGLMVRMKDHRLSKRSDTKKQKVADNEEDHSYDGGILCRGGRKVEREVQQQGPMERLYKSSRSSE